MSVVCGSGRGEERFSKRVRLFRRCYRLLLITSGLFDPGDLPKPTMETFTKDMEPWERTTPGVQTFEKNQNVL